MMAETTLTMLRAECLAFANALERFAAGELEESEIRKRAGELGFSLHIFARSDVARHAESCERKVAELMLEREESRAECGRLRARVGELEAQFVVTVAAVAAAVQQGFQEDEEAKTPGPDDVG